MYSQMLQWKYFRNPVPTPVEYSAMVPNREGVLSLKGAKGIYRARPLRWVGVKQLTDKSLAVFIDKEENFNFRPFVNVLTGIYRSNVDTSFYTLIFIFIFNLYFSMRQPK